MPVNAGLASDEAAEWEHYGYLADIANHKPEKMKCIMTVVKGSGKMSADREALFEEVIRRAWSADDGALEFAYYYLKAREEQREREAREDQRARA